MGAWRWPAGTPVLHPRFAEAGRKAWMLRDLGVEGGYSFDGGRTEALKGFSGPGTIYELLGPS